jgi:hypothetical protein
MRSRSASKAGSFASCRSSSRAWAGSNSPVDIGTNKQSRVILHRCTHVFPTPSCAAGPLAYRVACRVDGCLAVLCSASIRAHFLSGGTYMEPARSGAAWQLTLRVTGHSPLVHGQHWCAPCVHHLCSRIPFYRLRRTLRDYPELCGVGRLTLLESFCCVRLALWDEGRRRLISFHEMDRCYAGHRNSFLDGRQSQLPSAER